MLRLQKVSVTGDPSSGKTEACQFFRDLGAYVLSADEIAHSLLVPNSSIGLRIVNLLGSNVVVDNEFDKREIARKVFRNTKLLKSLEEILHPEIWEIIKKEYDKVLSMKRQILFVVEVPLLYETEYQDWFDSVVLIHADEFIRKNRFMNKKSLSEEEFYQRCARFLSYEERAQRASIVIENNGTKKELQKTIEQVYQALEEKI